MSLLPFWLPQMDKDIRKPAPHGYISPLTGKTPVDTFVEHVKPSVNKDYLVKPAENKIEIVVQDGHEHENENDTEETPLLNKQADQGSTSKHVLSTFKNIFSNKSMQGGSSDVAQVNRNKRIVLPVRIEPKVFFANERTFLSWLHCTTITPVIII